MKHLRLNSFSARLAAAVALVLTARGATDTWVGNTSVNWADPNWTGGNNPPLAGDLLVFGLAGAAGTSLNNNLASLLAINGITFNPGASAYTFNGNAITLAGNVTNSSTSLETINLPLVLTAPRTFTMTTGGGNLTLGGVLSGPGGFVGAGVGTLTVSNTANTFTGEEIFGGGTVNVAGAVVTVASLSDYGVPSSLGARLTIAGNSDGE